MPPAFEVLLLNTAIPQIQAAQSGDTYVVPRDIAFSAALTLSAGTANGVPYLNASKVLTTGSALTFDGTNLLNDQSTASPIGIRLRNGSTSTAAGTRVAFEFGGTTTGYIGNQFDGGDFNTQYMAAQNHIWYRGVSDAMILTSTGLGIGTSSPGFKLQVIGTSQMSLNGAGTQQALQLNNSDTTAGTQAVKLAFSSSSVTKASINAAVYGNDYMTFNVGSDTERARISSDGTFRVKGAGTAGTTDAVQFSGSAPASAMTLDASGNLGVGETNPTTRLHTSIARAATITSAIFGTTGTGVVNDENRLVIKNINTASGQNYGVGIGGLLEASASNTASLLFYTDSGTATTERARITSGGDLLVGKTVADFTTVGCYIDYRGTFNSAAASIDYLNCYNTTAGLYRFYVSNAGTINATSSTINTISDQRLKENIQDLDVGISAVMSLKPRKFDWKSGKGKDIKGDRGFIAQEFEQVFPDMVGTWKDPAPEGEEPYKSVRADLIPVLVKAIQEQQAMINELKAEVAALKGA